MPGFNQKGPDGAGAGTGRQRGMCRRTEPQSVNGGAGGRGRGMGMGRGLGQGQGLGRCPRVGTAGQAMPGQGQDIADELKKLREQQLAAKQLISTLEQKIAALEGGKE